MNTESCTENSFALYIVQRHQHVFPPRLCKASTFYAVLVF